VLFAAFPVVYASMFSGFYWALMFVLIALILRTVAIEFRSYSKLAGFTVFASVNTMRDRCQAHSRAIATTGLNTVRIGPKPGFLPVH
jgi:hypothetical protein